MKVRSGSAIVIGLFAVMIIGWFSYRAFIPPVWLRSFAEDISYRSTPDANASAPRDAREAKPNVVPDHPYICFAREVPFAWDQLIVVPSGRSPLTIPALSDAKWNDLEDRAKHMADDPRFQLIVLLKDRRVVADAYFYTFWGDLSALGTDEGFTPTTAVFTAFVRDATHVLMPVSLVPPVCKGTP